MYYVYIIKSERDGSLYIGYSDDLKRRIGEHNNQKNIFTRSKAPWELVYYEAYKAKSDARYRENNLKKFAKGYAQLKNRIRDSLK